MSYLKKKFHNYKWIIKKKLKIWKAIPYKSYKGASTSGKLSGMNKLYAKRTILKSNYLSLIAHFCLDKYSFKHDILILYLYVHIYLLNNRHILSIILRSIQVSCLVLGLNRLMNLPKLSQALSDLS